MSIIAIDLNSSCLTAAALTNNGKGLFKEKEDLNDLAGAEVAALIRKKIDKIFKAFESKPTEIKSIGVSVPGIYYSKTGKVWSPNINGWEDYPLKEELENHLTGRNIYLQIASKRTCYILGEMWQGAAKGSKNAIYLSVGNGIGAGVLIDGKILHGFNDGVGAIGWLAVDKNHKKEYSEKGTFEYIASGRGILNRANEAVKANPEYSGILKDPKLNIDTLFRAYKLKDSIAVKTVNKTVEYWGIAVANLISLFNPEIIVFGGYVFGPAIMFLDEIKKEALKWAQPLSAKNVKFVESKLGQNAGLYGAGQLARKGF